MQMRKQRFMRKAWLFVMLFCIFLLISCGYFRNIVCAEQNGTIEAVLDQSEKYCTIRLSAPGISSDSTLRAAVWSVEGGQNDLIWYPMASAGNGLWQVQCKIADHRSAGTYMVHIYKFSGTSPEFQNNTSFFVNGISGGEVSVENMNQGSGTCQVTIQNMASASGISKVQAAIWSSSDQSDIVWYSATNQTDDKWLVNMDIANHKYHLASYHIHVYATDGNGVMMFVGNTSVKYTQTEAQFSAVQEEQGWNIKATNAIIPGGIQKICFAVWSARNGQDDLIWYNVDYDTAGKQGQLRSNLSGHGDDGIYICHVYARMTDGSMVFLCNGEFEVTALTLEEMSVETDNAAGKFTVRLSGVQSTRGISAVTVAVWSQQDQGDLVWYPAVKQSDGTYVLSGDISRHRYNIGTYKAHAYLYDAGGRPNLLEGKSFSFSVSSGEITVEQMSSELQYQAAISDVVIPMGVKCLSFAVWSEENGQDDLVWYNAASKDRNTYTAVINLNNHKSAGKYCLHAYAQLNNGNMKLLEGITFVVESLPENNTIYYYNLEAGSFEMSVRLSRDISDVQAVCFPTWCDSDQNDIYWYEATKTNDNVYTVTTSAANHKLHYGTYITHVYYKDSAGTMHYVSASSCIMLQPDTVTVSSCTINGSQVIVQAGVDGTTAHEYGLFQLLPGQSTLSASAVPLATATGTSSMTLKTNLNLNTANSLLQAKLVIGLKTGNRYLQVTSGNYITNPEAVASQTFAFPTTSSKKGLQIHTDYMSDVNSLGVKHAVLNLTLNSLFSSSVSGIAYNYNGTTYYFDSSYVSYFDRITSQLAANGTVTSVVVLLQWNSATNNLIIPSGRTQGHSFYGLNTADPAAKKQLEAAFTFLGQRYANQGHKVVNWIMGNEVADYNQYYWCGNVSQEQYVEYYTDAYRTLYNSIKSVYSNARIYISLDQYWNYQRSNTYPGKVMLDSFAAQLSKQGNISWNIAFHPYPFPLTSANFWNTSSLVQDSANSPIITMKNLSSLTNYIKNTYGADKRFILSETGFTSVSNGTRDETLQAAAIAYAYYLAEFNDMVDAFVVHRHVDHRSEMNMGLYLGLWANENGSLETPTRQKYAWTVFQKMDTNQSLLYTNFALPYIGASDWYSIVPGFDPSRFQ